MKFLLMIVFSVGFLFVAKSQDKTQFDHYKKWIVGKWQCQDFTFDGSEEVGAKEVVDELIKDIFIQFKRNGKMIFNMGGLGENKEEVATYTVRKNNLIVITKKTDASKIRFLDKKTLIIYAGKGSESVKMVFSRV